MHQIASLFSARTQELLPSNTDKMSKEQVHAITLRSGKQLEQVQKESYEIVHQKDIGEEAKDSQRKIGQSREEFLTCSQKISCIAKPHWNMSLFQCLQ